MSDASDRSVRRRLERSQLDPAGGLGAHLRGPRPISLRHLLFERPRPRLRVMCWNIAHASLTGALPANALLPLVADQIRAKAPDLVLLNEVKNWREPFGDGVNQVAHLARATGLPHRHWGNTNATGLTGHIAVGVLSRYPLGPAEVHPVLHPVPLPVLGGSPAPGAPPAGTVLAASGYATLATTLTLRGLTHHVFATRFDAHVAADNVAGHHQAAELVRRLDPGAPVLFGGDLNAEPHTPQAQHFARASTLRDAYAELPDPPVVEPRIDYLFVRGPYRVAELEYGCPWPPGVEVSDHSWVFAVLEDMRVEDLDCQALRDQLARHEAAIREAQRALSALDPLEPGDARERQALREQLAALRQAAADLRARVSRLNCLYTALYIPA